MGLELDPKQVESIKAFLRRAAKDTVRLRELLAGAVFVIGWLAIVSPYETTLVEAREAFAAAEVRQSRAQDILSVLDQREIYLPLLTNSVDDVGWQTYVLGHVEDSGATLVTLEPFRREQLDPFITLDVELVATADGFSQVVDLVDRFERGERAMRVTHLSAELLNGSLYFTCSLHALIMPSDEPVSPEERTEAMRRAAAIAAARSDTSIDDGATDDGAEDEG